MKSLEQNELFQNLSGFLKRKGIEIKDGSYAQGIQKSCSMLTQAINLGQESLGRAKVEVDKTVNHLRRVIHEKTAPKSTAAKPTEPVSPAANPGPRKQASKKSAQNKKTPRKRAR